MNSVANKNSRIVNAVKNARRITIVQVLTILMQYICRIIFVRTLASDYVGLSGLFMNILQVLALTELGIGTAISYSLYKPLAENDVEKLKSIMALLKKAFYVVSIIIIISGIFVSENLSFFIVTVPNIPYLKIIFLMYVLDTAFGYISTVRTILINADQKAYISEGIEFIFKVILNILQCVFLIITHSFFVYVLLQFITNNIRNLVYIIYGKRHYRFFNENKVEKLDKKTFNTIIKNIKASFLHYVGYIIVEATDNILISKYINLSMVGKYSNYTIIKMSINTILNKIFNALTASVGNLGVLENKKKQRTVLYRMMFLSFVIYSVFSIGIMNVSSDFVELCFGKDYRIDNSIVIVISFMFFLTGMRKPTEIFLYGLGLFYYNRYAPIVEGIVNLTASLLLLRVYGTIGILVGTIISTIVIPWWFTPYVVIKKGLNDSLKKYFVEYFKYLFLYFFMMFFTSTIVDMIKYNLVINILIKGLLSIFMSVVIILIFYHKKSEYYYFLKIIKEKILRYESETDI